MNASIDMLYLSRRPDRRQRDIGPPAMFAERRIHAERRGILERPISLRQWAEEESNYYFHAGTHPVESRHWPDRRSAEIGIPKGGQERRLKPERRAIGVHPTTVGKWVEEMADFYFHFQAH